MSNRSPLLNVIFQSLNKITRNILRDYGEIENLQVSPNSLEQFVSKTEKSYFLKSSLPSFQVTLSSFDRSIRCQLPSKSLRNLFKFFGSLTGQYSLIEDFAVFPLSTRLLWFWLVFTHCR